MAVLDKGTCSNGEWNYSMLRHTVNTLRYSQGFYSRLANDLDDLGESDIEMLKEQLNTKPKFNNEVDVILFLEQ